MMRTVRTVLLATAAAAAVVAPALAGDVPRYEPAPAWAGTADALPAVAGESGLVLFDRAFKLEGGELWSFVDLGIKVTSAEALSQIGNLQVAWQPEHGDAVIHRVEILRDGRVIDALSGTKPFEVLRREQGLEQLMVNGQLTAAYQVRDLRLGDTLRFSFSVSDRDPVLGDHTQMIAPLVTKPVELAGGAVRLLWPTDAPVRWKVSGAPVAPTPTTIGRYTVLTVNQPLPKLPDAPDALPLRLQPVALVEASSFADWAEVSRLGARLFAPAGLIAPGSELAARADAIAAANPDAAGRAAGALRLVQDEVRYLFNGLAGGNYRPQTPAETWEKRYGDCKAKTLLLLALLDRLKVPAEAAFVNTTMADAVVNRVPSFAAFDHVIVRADLDGRTAWLDGTRVGDREADLFVAPAFRMALPARPAGGDLIAVPVGERGQPDQRITIDTDASAGLTLPATFTTTIVARDGFARQLKASAGALDRRAAEDQVDSYVGGVIDDAVIAAREWRFDEDTGALTITASGVRALDWSGEAGERALDLATVTGNLSLDASRYGGAWADAPLAVPDVSALEQRDIIRLPRSEGTFRLEGDPTVDATVGGLALTRTLSLDGDVVRFDEGRSQAAWEVPAAALPAEREAAARLTAVAPRIVGPADAPSRWAEVKAARAAGKLKPILAAFDAQVARAQPDDAGPLLARAAVHQAVFDWAAADADLTGALAIDPDESTLSNRAALRAIAGRPDSRDDLLKLRELDPASSWAANGLFDLHTLAGDWDGAEAVVERAAATGVDPQVVAGLRADLLGYRGRAAEGLALLTAATARKAATADTLNERCWFKARFDLDLAQALKDCTKAIELGSEPASYLDSRGLVYLRLDRPEDALEDLNAALALDPDLPASLYTRGLVKRRLGRPGAEADLEAAIGMAPTVARSYARFGLTAD